MKGIPMEEIKSNFIHDIIDADLAENPNLKIHVIYFLL